VEKKMVKGRGVLEISQAKH
jgi:hypothetical protein